MLWRCEYIPLKIALHHHNRNNSAIPANKCSVVYVIISESPETRLVPISIRAISKHKIESREISNRKNLSKTKLVCRERQAKNGCCPNSDNCWSAFCVIWFKIENPIDKNTTNHWCFLKFINICIIKNSCLKIPHYVFKSHYFE